MPTNFFVPVAAAAGANVTSDAAWDGSSFQVTGVTKGIVPSAGMNKAWRQGTMGTSALGQIIVDHGLIDAVDDGNVPGLKANLRMAFAAMLAGVAFAADQSGTPNLLTVVLDPAPPSLSTYRAIYVRVANTNTGAVTLTLNNLGNKPVVRRGGLPLTAGDLVQGQFVHLGYDLVAGQWVVLGSVASDTVNVVNQTGAIPSGKTTILSTVGSGTFTVPANVYLLRRVRMWGGGGGGGGASNTSSAGAGGGPGAYWEGAIPVTPGQIIPYAIGAGGTAGLGGASPTAGGTGGTTSFGSYVTCPGASGGQAANGGININNGLGSPATQAASLNGFIAPIAGAGIGYPVGSGYGGGYGAPAFSVSNAGPNVQAGGINGIYPGSGGNGSSANANGGAGAAGLIIIDM